MLVADLTMNMIEFFDDASDLEGRQIPQSTASIRKGTEKVIERLLSSKERVAVEKPLEENLQLGMKGPLASRKILERPQPPQGKVKIEAEIVNYFQWQGCFRKLCFLLTHKQIFLIYHQ